MIVTLGIDEVRTVAHVAIERWLTKYGSTDRPNYASDNKRALEPECAANIRACVAEYAVAKLYRLPWTFPWYPNDEHPWRKNLPDVNPNIEVKTVRTRDFVPVFPKDIRDGMLLVGARVNDADYYTEVEVFGWLDVMEVPCDEWYDAGENSWRVPLGAFNDRPILPNV